MSSPLVQLRLPGRDRSTGETPTPDAARKRVYIETYGCQMNVADSDMVLGLFDGAGYSRTDDPAHADVILINTCAVREKAEERVYARLAELVQHKRRGRDVVLGVTGCMAEHLKGKLRENAPDVDVVVGPDGYRRLLEHVARAPASGAVLDTRLDRFETYEGLAWPDGGELATRERPVTGHITIQRGCDKFCTFCIVPFTRGRERATAPREILRQARAMAAAGIREVQLLGQTVNSYRHEDVSFAELLRAVAAVDGIERVRFTSPYPLDFSADVIRAMAETPKVCKHVHLPLQSASDPVLARMRRGYSAGEFRALVGALRDAMPGIGITTDILVGFCDETEQEHAETLRAIEELRFDGAFMFAYSEREGTHAARKMPDTVPEETKQRRLAEVIALQQRVSGEIMQAQVGRRERVLVERVSKRSDRELLGRTDTFRSVIVPAAPGVRPGALVDVTIERATAATLFGRVES